MSSDGDQKPYRAHGWARGLIHFHTRFSDGWATVLDAAAIARNHGFDFLIVTDHIRSLKLKTRRTLDEYIQECDRASRTSGIPVIPGGEMEVRWDSPVTKDFSESHTIAFSIRDLVRAGEFDWQTPGTDPFAQWPDSHGERGTILALQEMLQAHNIPPAASHQFQHSPVSTKPGKYSDYRYDLDRFEKSQYVDAFYSGAVDIMHETEDVELVVDYLRRHAPKAVYASSDYHMGPEVLPAVADFVGHFPFLRRAYEALFRAVVGLGLRFLGDHETMAFPRFSEEQLSHATYVHLGGQPCTEESVLAALRNGSTCVSRGAFIFANLEPVPGFTPGASSAIHIRLRVPVSHSRPRPRNVLLLRDGRVVRLEPYIIDYPEIYFEHTETDLEPGLHVYQLYIPSKFLSSPMVFWVPGG